MTMRQTSYSSYYTKISAAGGRNDSSLLHLYGTNDGEREVVYGLINGSRAMDTTITRRPDPERKAL